MEALIGISDMQHYPEFLLFSSCIGNWKSPLVILIQWPENTMLVLCDILYMNFKMNQPVAIDVCSSIVTVGNSRLDLSKFSILSLHDHGKILEEVQIHATAISVHMSILFFELISQISYEFWYFHDSDGFNTSTLLISDGPKCKLIFRCSLPYIEKIINFTGF